MALESVLSVDPPSSSPNSPPRSSNEPPRESSPREPVLPTFPPHILVLLLFLLLDTSIPWPVTKGTMGLGRRTTCSPTYYTCTCTCTMFDPSSRLSTQGLQLGLDWLLTEWYLMWGFLLKENMPSGSSSSDLSAILSLDVSFTALSGVVGTAGSGSGVV